MSLEPRWRRVAEIFDQAVELPEPERALQLAAACGDDAALRREVESLLAAHGRAEGILERRPCSLAPTETRPAGTGRYRIVREIGRGGMGVVYEALDPHLERSVALKVLTVSLAGRPEARQRFLTEARAASRLDHPSICTVFDAGETAQGCPFLVMACYQGRTLDQRLAGGPVDPDEARRIALQVARGLQHAHGSGIVHRDVKPSNLLLVEAGEESQAGPRPQVKILDFGIARIERTDRQTLPGGLIGTLAYMSPEQARGAAVDHRTDLWSLGVVLCELLTGEHPFRAETEAATLDALLHRDPLPAAPGRAPLPPELIPIVRRALAKDPDERYPSASEMAADLERPRGRRGGPLSGGARTGTAPGRLPRALTSFVGRERELEQIAALLERERLVTLTGPGGTGKTRLAMEAAPRLAGRYENGVTFVPLAALRQPELVPAAVAQALGLEPTSLRPSLERVIDALAGERRLLILDNFEQVIAAAGQVARLLEACSGVRAMITSRRRLGLSGEHSLAVTPLPLPAPGAAADAAALERCPATHLFLDRARAVDLSFGADGADAAAVAEICRRLEGLPLAIELAAARVRLFSPPALLGRLERRLDALKTGARDLPDRHQTLRRAVAWSYELLPAHLQVSFRRLGIFVGSFTLEAAEEVVGGAEALDLDAEEAVAELIDQTLITRMAGEDGEPRFGMLETLREYALERLIASGEEETLCRAHARCFLRLAEEAAPELTGSRQKEWLARLEADHDNFRAAFAWALGEGETRTALGLGAAFWRYWLVRGPLLEGRDTLERALALPGAEEEPALRAAVLQGLGTFDHNLGRNRAARRHLGDALAIRRRLGDAQGMAGDLAALGWVACELSDLGRARELSEEALELQRRLGNRRGVAVALNNLGWIACYQGDCRRARALFEESLALRRAIGDRRGAAFQLNGLAWAALSAGDGREAARHLEEAGLLLDELGDDLQRVFHLCIRAMLAHDQEDLEAARELAERALELQATAPNRSLEAWGLTVLGGVLCDRGAAEEARGRLEAALAIWREIETPWGEAWARCRLAELEESAGERAAARGQYLRSLKSRAALGDQPGIAAVLEGLARLAIREEPERAARLLGAAAALRERLGIPLSPRRRTLHQKSLGALRRSCGRERRDELLHQGADLGLEAAVALGRSAR